MAFLTKCASFDLSSLSLVPRILFATDGTLTDMLEVIFLEPIGLTKLSCTLSNTSLSMPDLELASGGAIMQRRVLLFGRRTGRNYVYAESVVAADRVHPGILRAMTESDRPIGRLWSEFRHETYKEPIRMMTTSECAGAGYFFPSERQRLLMRSYRVIEKRQPIMVISEYVPSSYEGTDACAGAKDTRPAHNGRIEGQESRDACCPPVSNGRGTSAVCP